MIIPAGFPRHPASFDYETQVLESSDGEHGIFLNWFRKKGVVSPRRALLIVHGQGEHGGRYQHFVHYLQEEYDLIAALDLRGHGRSEGIRGHVENFNEYLDDALMAWNTVQKRMDPEGVVDWFAHSMGGTITLRLLQDSPGIRIRNLLLSSPCVGLTHEVPVVKEVAARLLSRVWGSLQLGTDLNPGDLSHDSAVVTAIQRDSLHHTKATPKFYLGFVAAMERLRSTPIPVPPSTRVLFQLAGDDRIVSTPEAERVFEGISSRKKKKRVYEGLYHEIFNEIDKERVFEDLRSFIREEGRP
ncbi:alpha/beta fold hydrolase [bacterium]|jgi:lysophospholipase|nr:alpha/beta fold hydrolase [bacterium]